MEIDTSESSETEATTFHEIQNPNDELAVTYLFYELQRTYRISERIHKLTPVILVANEVPAPHEIDDAWLIQHDWILRRAILDNSFRPALDYLTKSFVGAEVNIRILEANAIAQKNLVDKINQQIQTQMGLLASNERERSGRGPGACQQPAAAGHASTRSSGSSIRSASPASADSGAVDARRPWWTTPGRALDRAERERARLTGATGSRHDRAAVGGGQAVERREESTTTAWRRSTACACTSRKTSSTTCRRSGARSRRISASSGSTTSTCRS